MTRKVREGWTDALGFRPDARLATVTSFSSVLLLVFGGCFSSDTDCASVLVSPARAGAWYDFALDGYFLMPFTIGGSYVDWARLEGGSLKQQNLANLTGAHLRIAVGAEPTPRLALWGGHRDAYQATYWLRVPGHGSPIDGFDEWIDAETGGLVQAGSRGHRHDEMGTHHLLFLSRPFRPALLHSSPMWDLELRRGLHGEFSFPTSMTLNSLLADEPAEGHFRYDVTRTYRLDGACHADVRMEWGPIPGASTPNATIVSESSYRAGVALPVRFVEHYPRAETKFVSLTLVSHQPGAGNALAPFQDRASAPVEAKLLPPVDGFPAGTKGVFPTGFEQATAAARNDTVVGQWLRNNPESKPWQVSHTMGSSSSSVVDEWIIEWASSEGTGFQAVVTRTRPILPILPDEWQVAGTPRTEVLAPRVAAFWVTLSEMARIHRLGYGENPEVLMCQLADGYCAMGTHENTGARRAGEPGGGGPQFGLIFWLERGWAIQEQSLDQRFLGPPVPYA